MNIANAPLADGLVLGADGIVRCWWPGADPLYVAYHDTEWGRPVADDARLFEKICLEGFQSGLSWITILRKREGFRAGFAGFDPEAIARFDDADVERLVADAGIVRHRGKILSVINNARRLPALRDEFGSLAAFCWSFETEPAPAPTSRAGIRSTSPASEAMSKALRKRGWSFVGPTTIYAFMQSMGIVNDHLAGCAFRAETERDRAAFTPPRR
ncbi:MAG TPA: DNA-3-methyladenine glycosylase I [Methylomirabilota bacterium]|nr:DNA-3-methyladenine glycosylase I [Methylomirabilota bacterium]